MSNLKIYNKKGFISGVLWTAAGAFCLYRDVVDAHHFLPQQIKSVALSLVMLAIGLICLGRAFSKADSQRDKIEALDERSQLVHLKTDALTLRVMSWARLAALLQTGLTADCTALSLDADTGLLLQTRPAFGGNLMATISTPRHKPQMASVRPGIMKALSQKIEPDERRIVRHSVSTTPARHGICINSTEPDSAAGTSLNDSPVIVRHRPRRKKPPDGRRHHGLGRPHRGPCGGLACRR